MKFEISVFFRKSDEEIQLSSKFDKNNGYLHEGLFMFMFMAISHSVLRRKWNVVEKIKTRFMLNNIFFRDSCSLWGNVEKYGTAGQAIEDNTAHAHCTLDTLGYKHTEA